MVVVVLVLVAWHRLRRQFRELLNSTWTWMDGWMADDDDGRQQLHTKMTHVCYIMLCLAVLAGWL